MPSSVRPTRLHAALAVTVAAVVAVGVGELAAGFVQAWPSPVEAVADSVIDGAPSSLTRFGIRTFGTNDKLALVVGILLLLAVAAPIIGLASRRRPAVALAAFAGFGTVGVLASIDGGSLWSAVPSVAAALGGAAVVLLDRRVAPAARSHPRPDAAGRRHLLVGAGAFAAFGLAMAAAGRALGDRFSAAASRAALLLPRAQDPLPPPPDDASFEDIEGLAPLFTPNDDFYRIDTALTVPQLPVEDFTLRVTGMVGSPVELTFEELLGLGLVEADVTLTCVSNRLGGDLVGNARWLGIPVAALLERAGVDPAADQLVGRSVDGYTCGFPVEMARDPDRTCMVAVGMNGEPLPLEHGFPARLVTAGLYGYVSATKWLTEIELTTFADFDQYWVPRGYAERAPIKTMSRIDVPRAGEIVAAGDTVIAGVAWAQTRGIRKVEVSIDGEPFVETELAASFTDDVWRQWRLPWSATPGAHRLVVRATDGTGELQTQERTEPLPDGASGWPSLLVTVREP